MLRDISLDYITAYETFTASKFLILVIYFKHKQIVPSGIHIHFRSESDFLFQLSKRIQKLCLHDREL